MAYRNNALTRSKALAFSGYFIGAITFTTPAPVAMKNISWRLYLVFIACNVVSFVLIYLFVPETSRLSLEEIGELFGDEVVVHLNADGHGIIEQQKLQGAVHIEDIGNEKVAV